MEKTYTRTYIDRKGIYKYDSKNVIAYLNEEVIENYIPVGPDGGDAEPCTAYQYTGTEIDGGTIIPSESITDRGMLVNGIIRTKYTQSDELAIQRHYANDPEAYADEWKEYNAFCEEAKVQADKLRTI